MFKKLAVILLLILCGVWLYLSFDSEIQGDLSQLPAPPSIQKLSSDLAGSLTPMNFWEFEEGEDYAIADSPCGFGQESMIGRTYEVNNQKLNVLPVYAYEDKKVSDLMAKVRNTLGKRAVVLYYDAQAGLEDPDKGFMEFLSTFYNKPVLDANVEIPALRPLVIISPENDLIKFCRDPLPEDYQLQMPAGENYWDMVYLPQVGGMNSALRKAYSMNLFDGSDEQLVYDGELEEEFQPGIYRVGIIAADLEEGDKALCFGQGCDESDESVIAPESEQNPDENADGGAVNPNNDDQNTGSEDIVLPGGTTIKLPNKGIPTKGGINVSSNRSALFNTENQMKLVFKRHGNQLIDAGKSDINVFNAFAEDLDAVIGNELYTELASSLKLSFRRLQSMFLLINLNLKNYNMQELTQNNLKRIVGEFLDDENFTIGMQNKLYKIDDDFHILTGLYLDVNSSLEDHLRELKYYNIDQKDELKLSLANALLPFSAYEIEDIEARLLQRVNAVEILVRLLDQLLKNEDIKQKNIDDFLTVSNNLFNNLKFNNNTKNLYLDIIKGHIPEIDPMDGIVISHMYENGQGVFMYPAYKFMNIINNNDDNRTLKVTITGGGQFKIKINDTEETSDDGVIE